MTARPALVAACLGAMVGAAAWIGGCGVKSPPIPPQYAAPQQIVDLHATSQARGVALTWSRPERYAGGGKMRDLARFDLFRAEGDGPYQMLVEVPVTDQQRFQQQQRFSYLDATAQLGHTYRYQVFSETQDGYRSRGSNEVEITRRKPKPPPSPETFVLPTPTPPR
jgi:hypothetical protein